MALRMPTPSRHALATPIAGPVAAGRSRTIAQHRRLRAAACGMVAAALALGGVFTTASNAPGVRAATATYAYTVSHDWPAGYWRLSDRTGTTAAPTVGAAKGSYRYGPRLGWSSLLATDRTNSAVGFDGVNDDVRIPSRTILSPRWRISLEAWIQPSRLPKTGFASIVSKAGAYSLQFHGPRLEFLLVTSGVYRRLDAPSGAIRAGQVYHLVGTWDGSTQRLYVNGTLVAKRTTRGKLAANSKPVTIGSWNGREHYRGVIDEVAIYRSALSATKVRGHLNAGRNNQKPAPTPTPTPTPPPPTNDPAPSSGVRFGMAAHLMWQSLSETNADLDRMKAAGMNYVRFDTSWRNSEPSKGSYMYLDKLDQVISAVQSRGMSLTITVIETPSWANGGKGMFAPPTNPADYAHFVGMLAHRYAGRSGMVWEIWNEENDPHFWTTGPSVAQYTAMLKAAYSAIKAGDPDATVVTGGILFNDMNFLEGIYANGGGSSFDGLAIHPYSLAYAPGSTTDSYFSFKTSVPQFTAKLAAHGQASKPIWLTEMGWGTDRVSDATRATYLQQAVPIARAWPNVRGMGAYTIHQSQFPTYGLLTTSNQPTQSWNAYAAALQ